MYSIITPDGIETATQGVYWTILIIFFVFCISSWLLLGNGWFKEDISASENAEAREDIPQNDLE